MSEHLGYIDSYFNKELSPEECRIFDLRIEQDPAFAEEVAFYINALNTAKAELATQKKERFREIYQEIRPAQRPGLVRRFWPYVSAAAVLFCVIWGIYLFNSTTNPQELADQYLHQYSMGTTMGPGDSLEKGKSLFKEGRYAEALRLFEWTIQADSSKTEVKSYAGFASLHLKEYDKALKYFILVENTPQHKNPGKFYHALTLMKRDQPGDKEAAKKLLHDVIENDLAEKKTAQEWYKKF